MHIYSYVNIRVVSCGVLLVSMVDCVVVTLSCYPRPLTYRAVLCREELTTSRTALLLTAHEVARRPSGLARPYLCGVAAFTGGSLQLSSGTYCCAAGAEEVAILVLTCA